MVSFQVPRWLRIAARAEEAAAPRVRPDAAEEEEGPRAFWWLFAVMGALAALSLVGWVAVKRRSLVEAGIVAGTLAVLVLVGYHLTQGATPAESTRSSSFPLILAASISMPVRCRNSTMLSSRSVTSCGR